MGIEEHDPHTGYRTTGHEWNGITELNRPIPKVIWAFILVTHLFAIIWWVLMPAWPLWNTYTQGVLGVDQRERVAEDLADQFARRTQRLRQIEDLSFDQIRSDPKLMMVAREAGRALFGDNCAVCHGTDGKGGPGYPDLTDDAWLWGNDPETITETIRVGINAEHPESRYSQMLAFGRDGLIDRDAVSQLVSYVERLANPAKDGGAAAQMPSSAQLFADNCASCHGDDGGGNADIGAPDLTDKASIYGSDRQSLFTTIHSGRQGQMPAWEARLTPVEQKTLTLYILDLAARER